MPGEAKGLHLLALHGQSAPGRLHETRINVVHIYIFGTGTCKQRGKSPSGIPGHSSCANMYILIRYIIKHSSYQIPITSSGKSSSALRLSLCIALQHSLWSSPTSLWSSLEGSSRYMPGAKPSSLLARCNLYLTFVFTAVPQPWSTLFVGLPSCVTL